MVACCVIPITLIAAIGVFGLSWGALTLYLPYAIVLLCPLMMFLMMRGMGHEQQGNAERGIATPPDEHAGRLH
jgi:hypothetical protein